MAAASEMGGAADHGGPGGQFICLRAGQSADWLGHTRAGVGTDRGVKTKSGHRIARPNSLFHCPGQWSAAAKLN